METRAVLYGRVSTDEQSLGLVAQLDPLEAEAERRSWNAEVVTDEGVSGGTPVDERPALGPVLAGLSAGDVLVVAKLDRLSRSLLDFAGLIQRAESQHWSLVVLDIAIDTTTPQGKLIAHMLVAVAQWEREMIGLRIREGLAKSPNRPGRKPGLPPVMGAKPSALPPEVVEAVRDLREAGKSPGAIADRLNAYGHKSLRGGRWHRTSVRRLLSRLDAEVHATLAPGTSL
jgi:DNA invertase Pin-like site-specific DNA recombinase